MTLRQMAVTAIALAIVAPVLRADIPPPPAVPCFTKIMKARNPDDYLPAAARAEKRSGNVIVEVRIMPGASRPLEVRLIESSSHADLDEAAMRLAVDSSYMTNCPNGGSFKFRVKFTA